MIIGLLSDTHVRVSGYRNNLGQLCTGNFPSQIKDAFRGVDMILHAGDIYTLPILDKLERMAPTLASEGDDDPFEIMNDKRVKSKHILTIEGVTIGLAHQWEMWSLDGHETPLDVIVFGHLHKSSLQNQGDVLWVNPGSPTFPAYQHKLGTVGLLTIESGKASAEIIQLEGEFGGSVSSGLQR